MLFSSNIFIFLFLTVALAGYYLLHKPYRNIFLLLMSLLFYAWGEPKFVIVMIGSIIFNYIMAMVIGRFRERKKTAKALLAICVAGNLGLLFTFKYLGFFISNINRFGIGLPMVNLALPIGISFFTFQAMSYVIDVYRGDVQVQLKPHYIGLYISFFPQLIAGPIVRYKDIEEQIDHRSNDFDQFGDGVRRFIIGFGKKILLANNMALIADKAFALPDAERSVIYAWLGALAYSFQILFDFSGYSDMAIGLGKMFGFRFLENFNYPYISQSISEFWRRWHMSLEQWFRDYVYFPLGGSRTKSTIRLVFNLFVVWALTGAWHGANWNFILWGLLYFVLIAFEKLTGYPQKFKSPVPKGLYRAFTLLCVLGGWVLFRASGTTEAIKYGLSMFGLRDNPLFCDNVILTFREYWLFLVAAALCSTELFKRLRSRVDNSGRKAVRICANAFTVVFYLFCFFWSVSFLILGAHNPFIYFNF
ncbi:MAG: MBOAT family protein [Oscillospiraceae bacterium]|nr:MBOAT family protein [Oscillospiraceae bacterium]